MDVSAWLRGLGLEQYEPAFRDNAVDADVLSELTDADLEKLGVLLGHRKKLLRAIAALRSPPLAASYTDGEVAAAVSPAAAEAPVRPAEPQAERRQLTVMFCRASTFLAGTDNQAGL